MDIIPIQCPHCLGELEVNWGVGTAGCLYCRGKMVIKLPADVFVGREQPKPTARNQASPIQRAPIHQHNQRQSRLTAFFQKQNFLFYFSGERQVLPRQWQSQVLASFQVPETETPLALLTAKMTGKKANAGLLFGVERVPHSSPSIGLCDPIIFARITAVVARDGGWLVLSINKIK